MILGRLLVVLFSLAKTLNASILSIEELDDAFNQLTLKDDDRAKVAKISKSLSLTEKINEQKDVPSPIISITDLKTIVSQLDIELSGLLNSGTPPQDAANIIKSSPLDVEKLIAVAYRIRAKTLLKLLQLADIWRDENQFHSFQAFSYNSPWYDRDFWNSRPMDWDRHLWAVCVWDNYALATVIQESILTAEALEKFDEKLLVLCVKYDAVKVFESTVLEPSRLKEHLGNLSKGYSAKLLKLYQGNEQIPHLHLENYPPPDKLPASANDLYYLMSHGHNCFPMDQFIKKVCDEGRLDLFKKLYEMDPVLFRDQGYLKYVAAIGQLDIIEWANKCSPIEYEISRNMAVILAINQHLKALDWLVNEKNMLIDPRMIEKIAEAGALEALEWINNEQPIKQGKQSWANLAAIRCHLPVLKWLYQNFKLVPKVEFLKNATIKMLKWIRNVDKTLIGADLIVHGVKNLRLLQWVHKNVSSFIFEEKREVLAKKSSSKKTMVWFYEELNICPSEVGWAFKTGDLDSIQWAVEKCQVSLKPKSIYYATVRGHFHIIEWIQKKYPEYYCKDNIFKGALEYETHVLAKWSDSLKISEEISCLVVPEKICADQRLNLLKWLHERDIDICSVKEMDRAAEKGDLQIFKWFRKTFPTIQPSPRSWNIAAFHGNHKIYDWLQKKYPRKNPCVQARHDIAIAYTWGHLETVKVILKECPMLITIISGAMVTRESYHVKNWLIANDMWDKGRFPRLSLWLQKLINL